MEKKRKSCAALKIDAFVNYMHQNQSWKLTAILYIIFFERGEYKEK
jgi:hypothetical protein